MGERRNEEEKAAGGGLFSWVFANLGITLLYHMEKAAGALIFGEKDHKKTVFFSGIFPFSVIYCDRKRRKAVFSEATHGYSIYYL